MPRFTAVKGPNEVLEYTLDWDALGVLQTASPTELISTSTWTAEAGITIDTSTNGTTETTVWLSGGTVGNRYKLTNKITTDASPRARTFARDIYVFVEHK